MTNFNTPKTITYTSKETPPPFLEVAKLNVIFNQGLNQNKNKELHAVKNTSFSLNKNEILGIVGESGCGKSTIARTILQLQKPTSGKIRFKGQDLSKINKLQQMKIRRDIQLIFQDPLDALNPRMTAGQIISEPLHNFSAILGGKLNKVQMKEKLHQVMDSIGLQHSYLNRYPHEFSGGQCQRIGIARAMIVNPKLLVCDEPVSALDVSIQAQIINLLLDQKDHTQMSMIFISHDLKLIRHISDRVLVMCNGEIIESGDTEDVYQNPKHTYTKKLLHSIPLTDPVLERKRILNM